MRFLLLVAAACLSATALYRRFRYAINWVDHPQADLVIIYALAGLGLVLGDLILNTRPVPGDEHAGLLEWAMRLGAIGCAGWAFHLTQ